MLIPAREATIRRQCTMRELCEAVIHEGLTSCDKNGFELVTGKDPIARTLETAAHKCSAGTKTAAKVNSTTAIVTRYTFSQYSFTMTRDLYERTLSSNCDGISLVFFGGPCSEKARVDWLNDVYFDERDINKPVHEFLVRIFGEHGEHTELPQITLASEPSPTKEEPALMNEGKAVVESTKKRKPVTQKLYLRPDFPRHCVDCVFALGSMRGGGEERRDTRQRKAN